MIGVRYQEGETFTDYLFRKNIFNDIIGIYTVTNSSCVLQAEYIYDAWGNCKVVDSKGNEITNTNHIGNINPFRYRGYYYDAETGLYFLSSRYYNPEWGRFISPDSIDYLDPESVNGFNLYSYCGNDPVNNADPSGHFVITAAIIWTTIGIGTAIGAVTALASSINNGDEWYETALKTLSGGLLGGMISASMGIGAF